MTYRVQQYKETTAVITTPRNSTTALSSANISSVLRQAVAVVRWPFTNRYAAPIWLLVRLYVGWIFLTMGLGKLQTGFLASDQIGPMLKLVADGTITIPLPFYRDVAAMLVDLGVTPMISFSMPFLELAVAIAMFTGVLTPVAAIGALLLNINFVLSGIGNLTFDGPYMVAEILIAMAYPVAGVIGFQKLAMRLLGSVVSKIRPARRSEAASAQVS
jgi:thiosulfate dehydrogenase (quinone) large subunit